MKNIITWEESGSESFLDVDVKLSISLQVVNPFLQHHPPYQQHIVLTFLLSNLNHEHCSSQIHFLTYLMH